LPAMASGQATHFSLTHRIAGKRAPTGPMFATRQCGVRHCNLNLKQGERFAGYGFGVDRGDTARDVEYPDQIQR
ncbi:hypothetical protein, partial [Pseudomonas quasicaspiana]|uniref:hypothetical protein n=1 Tax=Pseudomonas quasicaspiana TaxID=2829821 RepID=UPI001E4B1A71